MRITYWILLDYFILFCTFYMVLSAQQLYQWRPLCRSWPLEAKVHRRVTELGCGHQPRHGCGAGIKSRDKRARIVNINNMQRSAVRSSPPVIIGNRPSVASQKSVHYNDTKLSNYAKLSGITTIVGKTHSGRERRRRMRIYCGT